MLGRIQWGRRIDADDGQIVVVARIGRAVTQRQHRAAVEVEHQTVGLIDGRHAQRRQPRRRPAWFGRILLQPYHFRAGVERVANDGKAMEPQPAVEQVGLDPLRGERALTDRDVAHQRRVRQG